jgi:hypothetical protein
VVPNQPNLEADARLLGETKARRIARVRHGTDDIGVDRVVPGEHNAQLPTNLVDVFPEHLAVRTREVNELKDTFRLRLLLKRLPGTEDPRSSTMTSSWLNVPDIFGADNINAQDSLVMMVASPSRPKAERAEGLRVPRR